jgi:Rrf2 family protein
MNYQRATRYALYAVLELAAAPAEQSVTAAQVAAKYRIPGAALAKVFQRLVHAGLATGTRGSAGGYRLARPAPRITVLDVIEVFESPRHPGSCLLGTCDADRCDHFAECRLRHLFDEVDEQARATFASVTLETLVAPPRPLLVALPGLTPTRSSPAASRSRRRRPG